MCLIVQERLVKVAEERQLLVEEQGGFRRGRGCRDQILSCIGTVGPDHDSKRGKGILAAFINFKKAYNRVDRSKLWSCLEEAGLKGRMVDFLRAAYKGCKCEVKVGDMVSELFDVVKSLRQGCILSPVLCSLYINSLVDKLREAGIRVECRSQRIPALLYADGMVILADDEKMLRRALYEMGEWCVE